MAAGEYGWSLFIVAVSLVFALLSELYVPFALFHPHRTEYRAEAVFAVCRVEALVCRCLFKAFTRNTTQRSVTWVMVYRHPGYQSLKASIAKTTKKGGSCRLAINTCSVIVTPSILAR